MSVMADQLPGWGSRPCGGTHLVLWYGPLEPDEPGGYVEPVDRRVWREALACRVCASCPFRLPCLESEAGLEPGQVWGVRGGLTARGRRALYRRRRAAA